MRLLAALFMVAVFLTACDDTRVYQEYVDFEQRYWMVGDYPTFEFEIGSTQERYNVYCNIRNATTYPYSRLFFTYYVQDSTGRELEKKLMQEYLFDAKTGKPFGKSGLGDLYDHQFLLLKDYQFDKPGTYKIKFEQFMRTDTLEGILAVGLQIQKSKPT